MKEIKIGLLGFGTVGTGVAKILMENMKLISARVGANLKLSKIADIDITTDRGIEFDKNILTKDPYEVVNAPEIDIIVEMIGGETIAKELILKSIENKKPIVTANKALIATQGNDIIQKASENNVDFFYEASIGGCMPIVKTIREALVGNKINSMSGILNGTCNYILSKITHEGISFETALLKAQENGYAEADPTLDIQGIDAAHKISILTSLAFGTKLNLKDIYIEGISKITPLDIQFADQFGYRIKLLAISKNKGDVLDARVHPTMIPFNNLLSNVNGTLNAMDIFGDCVGNILLYGHGAGMMPTASAVISDIGDIARNILTNSKGRIPLLSFQQKNIREIPIMPIDDILTHYYFRFSALDRPGVLSKISGILGECNISLQSVHQKGRKTNGSVPIVMLSHLAKEAHVQKALSEISRLEIVSDSPVLIRIEDTDDPS